MNRLPVLRASVFIGTLLGLGGTVPAAEPHPPADTLQPYNSGEHTTRPLPPDQAAAQWKFPEGFSATVFASEPQVRQPIAMTFDDRGRLWVAECYTYAEVRKGFDDSLHDRILIFEDRDGDGRFDERKVFADHLHHLSSIEIGMGGVWALTSPSLVFIPDRNQDDTPDAAPEVVLDGFEWQRNHHTIANGLRWGPDGWLYGRHGIQAVSEIGKPGTPSPARARTNGGIWRYHPQRQTVEIVCHGTTNPWGMDWNEVGEGFFINTVIGHLWHILPGAHFRRMHGMDLNSRVYEVIDHHADHVHWAAGEAWNSWRKVGTTDATSAAGGGHAHTGLMFYGGENWPTSWHGKLLTINFNGRRLNVENVTRQGSGYVGQHQPDIGFSADPFFRGIDLRYGPDGGVYIADWSDSGECHDDDGVYRESGRIYKITYGKPNRPRISNIAALPPRELLPLLDSRNEFEARHARRRLQEMAALPDSSSTVAPLREALMAAFAADTETVTSLRKLWALNALGGLSRDWLRSQLQHPDEHVRVWAVRLLVDDPVLMAADGPTLAAFKDQAEKEKMPSVRLALTCALQRIPLEARLPLARQLARHEQDAQDHNIPLMLWYGIEPVIDTQPDLVAGFFKVCRFSQTRRSLARCLTDLSLTNDLPLSLAFNHVRESEDHSRDLLQGMWDSLKGQRQRKPPATWPAIYRQISQTQPTLHTLLGQVGLVYGDPAALNLVRNTALNNQEPLPRRQEALRALINAQSGSSELRTLCESLLLTPGLSATAAEGLSQFRDAAVVEAILDRISMMDSRERGAVLSVALSRPEWARTVLEGVAAQRIKRSELTTYHARQIRNYNNADLNARLEKVWGSFREASRDKNESLSRWKTRLTPEVLVAARLDHGRVLFQKTCGACHTLNGEGGKVGPELTGSARDNIDYLLQNILDPSAAVAREYQMVTLQTRDGRALSGFVRSRNATTTVFQTLSEEMSIPNTDIESMDASSLSMMPEGLLDSLTEEEVRDLIAYLAKK